MMLLGPDVVDVSSVPRVSTMLASLLLGFPAVAGVTAVFSTHAVVGISDVVGSCCC